MLVWIGASWPWVWRFLGMFFWGFHKTEIELWYCVCMIFLVHTQIYDILMCFTTYKKIQGNNRYWILRSLTFGPTSSLGFSHRWFQTRYKAVVGDLVVCTYCEWRSLEPALIACRGMWQDLLWLWGNGTLQVAIWLTSKQVLLLGWYCWRKNSAPLRMLQMLVLYQYQDLLGHPKWCRIFPSTVWLRLRIGPKRELLITVAEWDTGYLGVNHICVALASRWSGYIPSTTGVNMSVYAIYFPFRQALRPVLWVNYANHSGVKIFRTSVFFIDRVVGVPQVILAKVFSGSTGPSSQKYESFMYDIYFGGLLLNNGMWM